MLTKSQATDVAQWIVNAEARRDKQGKLRVYRLPASDGGGAFEVAGVNDRYHADMAHRLRNCIESGSPGVAEAMARDYIQTYTDVVAKWKVPNAAEAYLRDCAWNRGPKGALRILQRALGVADDGKFGPVTAAHIRENARGDADAWLRLLRRARERYERAVAPPVGKRAALWAGLVNRWDNAVQMARRFA
jgi:hypothetical protein